MKKQTEYENLDRTMRDLMKVPRVATARPSGCAMRSRGRQIICAPKDGAYQFVADIKLNAVETAATIAFISWRVRILSHEIR
jgi:hypothetical protein